MKAPSGENLCITSTTQSLQKKTGRLTGVKAHEISMQGGVALGDKGPFPPVDRTGCASGCGIDPVRLFNGSALSSRHVLHTTESYKNMYMSVPPRCTPNVCVGSGKPGEYTGPAYYLHIQISKRSSRPGTVMGSIALLVFVWASRCTDHSD